MINLEKIILLKILHNCKLAEIFMKCEHKSLKKKFNFYEAIYSKLKSEQFCYMKYCYYCEKCCIFDQIILNNSDFCLNKYLVSVADLHGVTELIKNSYIISQHYVKHLYEAEIISILTNKNQTNEFCLAAVEHHGSFIEYVIEKTETICIAALKQQGYFLKYVTNQTETICLAAVNQESYALQYVNDQTEAICLAAVHRNGYALQYVINQTEAICLAAVNQNGFALHFVTNQTEYICLAAVNQNGFALQYVTN